MSKNNSKKEFLFAIYLKLHKEILEGEIGVKIEKIHLEKWFKGRKVDMNCITKKGERLLIEWQMDYTSYKNHILQIKELIAVVNDNEKNIILYGMLDFKEELITELMQNVVLFSKKDIRLIFIKINSDVLEQLVEINNMDEPYRLSELVKLDTVGNMFLDKKEINVYNNSLITHAVEDVEDNYSYKEKLLIDIVQRLREDCREISPNVYQYKAVSKNNFGIGAGYEDIGYRVCCDRKGRVSVELCFNAKQKQTFYKLLAINDILEDEFNFILKFDEHYQKIGTYYPIAWFYTDKELMIKRFCRDVKIYLTGFYKYLKQVIEQ